MIGPRRGQLVVLFLSVVAAISMGAAVTRATPAAVAEAVIGAPPSAPPVRVCDNPVMLSGPAAPPQGAVAVKAGVDNVMLATAAAPPGSTFWLSPGQHHLGTTEFGQVIPKEGNTYLGAPGAVLDGQGLNRYAFTQTAAHVTIRYLTIQNFTSPRDEGVVNHDSGIGWAIEHNTIRNNGGAGVFAGTNNVIRYNCLTANSQYGFQGVAVGGPTNLTIDHNEISYNNTGDWEAVAPGCGCTGGGKFWDADGARVTNNWVHHNKSVGLWADTNNSDFLVEGNFIEANDSIGFFYEASYNAIVRNNTFERNALTAGRINQARGDGFPMGAIYLSEAGGDPRVASPLTGTTGLEITGNSFVDNWDGVVLWENADRFYNSPANTSGTSYIPKGGVASTSICADPASGGAIYTEPGYSDCRWKTRNVLVSGNTFTFDPAAVSCTSGLCGRNAQFSQYGTFPSWSPYKGWAISEAITFNQNNVWTRNSYTGTWKFLVHDTGRTISPSTWQAAPYGQDPGSTFDTTSSTTPPPPTTTTSTTGAVGDPNHLDGATAGFERSVGSWVPWYSASLSRSGYRTAGRAGGRVDITAPYGWGLQLSNWPGFSATSGTKTIGFAARLGVGKLGATMTVTWRDDSGTALQTDRVWLPDLTTAWQRASMQVTAPAGTTRVWVEVTGSAGGLGDYLYLDDIVVG